MESWNHLDFQRAWRVGSLGTPCVQIVAASATTKARPGCRTPVLWKDCEQDRLARRTTNSRLNFMTHQVNFTHVYNFPVLGRVSPAYDVHRVIHVVPSTRNSKKLSSSIEVQLQVCTPSSKKLLKQLYHKTVHIYRIQKMFNFFSKKEEKETKTFPFGHNFK